MSHARNASVLKIEVSFASSLLLLGGLLSGLLLHPDIS